MEPPVAERIAMGNQKLPCGSKNLRPLGDARSMDSRTAKKHETRVLSSPPSPSPITLWAQVKALQTQLGKLNPLQTVKYMLEQAQTLLTHHATGRDNLDADGCPTWKTEACRSWSTFASLAKGTIVGLPHWCTGDKVMPRFLCRWRASVYCHE